METIDILLATYNGEKYLREQIDSILQQTYKNIRLIISDDCSSDNTMSILREYEKRDERVIVYSQHNNLGVIKNFEFLLSKVENELYMLSDQDDIWLSDKVEKTYDELKKNNADLVYTDLEIVDADLNTIDNSFNRYMKLDDKIKNTLKNTNMSQYLYNTVTGCTIMSKKKFIKDMLPIPTESKFILHDTWIALYVSLNGKIFYLNKPTIKYRQHEINQVGIRKKEKNCNTFEEYRNTFINSKIELFDVYIKNGNIFPEEFKKLNKESYDYFKYIKDKKYIAMRKIKTFHKLYNYENFKNYIGNLIILNVPIIAKIVYKMKEVSK